MRKQTTSKESVSPNISEFKIILNRLKTLQNEYDNTSDEYKDSKKAEMIILQEVLNDTNYINSISKKLKHIKNRREKIKLRRQSVRLSKDCNQEKYVKSKEVFWNMIKNSLNSMKSMDCDNIIKSNINFREIKLKESQIAEVEERINFINSLEKLLEIKRKNEKIENQTILVSALNDLTRYLVVLKNELRFMRMKKLNKKEETSKILFGQNKIKYVDDEKCFIRSRHNWDAYINYSDGDIVPLTWVLPTQPSSDDWSQFLFCNNE